MRFVYSCLIAFFCFGSTVYAQQISVDNSVGLQSLFQDNLVDGNSCVEISNITSSVNGNATGFPSYAYFERGSSNFPFENGIVLSTGNANSAGNGPISDNLDDGTSAWGTDPDIETALGISSTQNATSVEFDFISASNQLQFNYLIASEEYLDANACTSNDSFVFLIREASSTGPYQNIAVIPATTIPISISNIHGQFSTLCPAQNEQYFGGFDFGDTNFQGRTTILSALTTITPNTRYHIKLIIADYRDSLFDSAVFIEGNSINNLELGEPITTCFNEAPLRAFENDNPIATYQWYLNGSPIPGATNNSYLAQQNGIYRVEVSVSLNGSPCTEEDEVEVTLNVNEPFTGTIDDFLLCDDPSNGSGETFDLTTKTAEILAGSPFTTNTSSITYHTDLAAANDPNNPGISNITTSGTTIYVRIEDGNSDCKSTTSFEVIANPLPIANTIPPIEECDNDDEDMPDGRILLDLTDWDIDITNDPSYIVTYHRTTDENSPIIDNGLLFVATGGETVFARVTNPLTSCRSEAIPVVIDIILPPSLPETDKQFLDACDNDGTPGRAEFDLTEVIDDVLVSLPEDDYSISFYEDRNDAREGNNNFINNPSNFENTDSNDGNGQQSIYLRVEDKNTGCATVVEFEIHTSLLLTGTDLGDFALCDDDTDSTNHIPFRLSTLEDFINNPRNPLPNRVNVAFYLSEEDRTNNNPITDDNYPVSGFDVLYLRLNDGNCTRDSEITLRVNPIIIFDPILPKTACDTDDDGITEVNLNNYDEDILVDADDNFTVTYFLDESAADTENPNPNDEVTVFTNTDPITTVYARIESELSGRICYTVNEFQVEVIAAPATNTPDNILRCLPTDSATINLETDITPSVVVDPTGLEIEYFRTQVAATTWDPNNPSSDWISHTDRVNLTLDEGSHEIFIRVENPNIGTDCQPAAIESFMININTEPIIDPNARIAACGETTIDLHEFDEYLLNGQTGKEVLYLDINGDELPDTINSYSGTITVRIQNITDSDCYAQRDITIISGGEPNFILSNTIAQCVDIDDTGLYMFSLEKIREDIQQSSLQPLSVTFFEDINNLEDNIQDIDDQITYAIPSESTTIFVRIENTDSGCYEPRTINITAKQNPIIENIIPFEQCDNHGNPYNDEASFNLNNIFNNTDNEDPNNLFRIGGERAPDLNFIQIHYFREETDINFDDVFDNSNAIVEPELSSNFISQDNGTIYVKVSSTITECFTVFPVELNVISPPSFNNQNTIPVCYSESGTYDLSFIDNLFIEDTSLVTIVYSDNSNNVLVGNIFTVNSTGDYVINAEITDINTSCSVTTSFTLQINPNPIANNTPDLYYCDEDNDNIEIFNLLDNESLIRGASQPASQFSLTFYNDLQNAEDDVDAISNNYEAEDEEIIYARLENLTTRCFDVTEFQTRLNPKPIIPIETTVPLCNDVPIVVSAETGFDGDTYLWSTGETSAEILIEPSDLVGGTLNLTVEVTRPYLTGDCTATHNFTVIASDEADIVFTPKLDFADPNRIIVEIDPLRIGDYIFLLDGVENTPNTSNIFENVTYGQHTVTVRDINGCNDVSQNVFVFDVPKFFTPNNDEIHDTWHIVGIERPELTGTTVYVYNRYGKLIKTLTDNSEGWDGTFNGTPMPSDDYWYVAKVVQLGNIFDVKGHFTLKR